MIMSEETNCKKRRLSTRAVKAIIIVSAIILILAIIVGSFNIYFAVLGSEEQTGVARGTAWSPDMPYSEREKITLDMGGEDYKVLILTDIHLKNSGTFAAFLGINYILDWTSKGALDKLVEKTDPDLILILGDSVLTDRNDIETERIVSYFDSYEIPWACVFGNHDDEGRADKAKLVDVLETSKYGLFTYGPEDLHGAGNYVIELTRGGKTSYAMFMMDSGSSKEFEAKTDGINEKQVQWYEWNMEAMKSECGEYPANMAFFHIPLKVYEDLNTFEQGERA